MATRRKLQKVFALLLAASMTMSLLSVGAFAADENGEETVKLSSVTLPEEYQDGVSVAYGTAVEDIELPQTLVGTVEQEEELPAEELQVPGEGEDVQNPGEGEEVQNPGEGEDVQNPGEGEDVQNPGEGEDVQNPGEGEEVQNPGEGEDVQNPGEGEEVQNPGEGEEVQNPGEGEEVQNPGEGEEVQNPGEGEDVQNPGETVLTLTDTKMEPAPETTVEVPVTWSCESYDGWTAGEYTFTASLDSGFVYESELPSITVTVEESKINIDSQYIITTETEDPQAVLKNAMADGADALIQAGTYEKGFTVEGITLYVAGEVFVNGGLSLKNAVLAGYTEDDVLSIEETSETTVNEAELRNLTVNITGSVHNYLLHWQSGNFIVNNAVLSASGNDKGCGLYAGGGTAGSKFTANESDVSFCNNVQGDGGSGIWANTDGNPNAVFEFTDSSLKLNNNGLNGFLGQNAPVLGEAYRPTFTFTNTNVEAIGNGSPTDGGNGDGFSYGYITLKNTDDGNYIFNVSGNDKNGLDGGRNNNAALDAEGYHIIANDNGSIGINISKLNVGKAESAIKGCTVEANGNGSYGLQVKQPIQVIDSTITANGNGSCGMQVTKPMQVINSTITANENGSAGFKFSSYSAEVSFDGTSALNADENTENGFYFYGKSLTAQAGSEFQLCGNHSSGLFIYSGEAVLQDSDVTITGNSNDNPSSYFEYYGGGIYNNGTLTLPADAVIYNNHDTKTGDDIYCTDKSTLVFGKVGSDWKLDDCGDKIDGWYDDSADARWEAHGEATHVQEFDEFELLTGIASVTGKTLALKAAHGVIPEEPESSDWDVSKSKTATNLEEQKDGTYTSEVTLSLPAAQETLESDVVFVLDKSTSAAVEDQMIEMLGNLSGQAEETGAAINVGVVIFNKDANRVLELTPLNSDNMGKIEAAIRYEISSGTNTHAGLLAGKAMLDEDTSVDANRKYLVFVSDGLTYLFDEPAQAINSQQATNGEYAVMAGNDCWGIRHYEEGGDKYVPDNWSSYLKDVGSHLDAVEEYIQPYSSMNSENHIPRGNTELPSTVDVALYKTWQVYTEMQSSGYRCYSMTAQSDAAKLYPWGPAFMEHLANGEEVSFTDIQNDIYYLLAAGSKVVDVIGYGEDNKGNDYNFDFVDDIGELTLTVGGKALDKTELIDPQFTDPYVTSAYGFGATKDGYDFVLYYYADGQDGKSDECFVWEINVPVSNFAPVELTYTVQLTDPQTGSGTYGKFDADGSKGYDSLLTNLSATLYPVDSNEEEGAPEDFAKPTVSYTVKDSSGGGGDKDDGDDDDDDGTDIPDENTPTTDLPVDPGTNPETNPEDPGTDLEDPDVPLAEVPETGDASAIWLALSALSGTGLAGVTFLGRKKKEQE